MAESFTTCRRTASRLLWGACWGQLRGNCLETGEKTPMTESLTLLAPMKDLIASLRRLEAKPTKSYIDQEEISQLQAYIKKRKADPSLGDLR
jgi:hypothetical protein